MNSFASRFPELMNISGGPDSYRDGRRSWALLIFRKKKIYKRPGGGIGRRAGLKHLWETVPVRLRSWVR